MGIGPIFNLPSHLYRVRLKSIAWFYPLLIDLAYRPTEPRDTQPAGSFILGTR